MIASLMLLPFLDFAAIELILKNQTYFDLFALVIASFISGIPLGWFVFQVYTGFFHKYFGSRYAWVEPRQILKSWDKGKICTQFRHHLMNYALLKSEMRTLGQGRWSHASARIAVGLLVPLMAPFFTLGLWAIAQLTPLTEIFVYYNSPIKLLLSFTIWAIFFVILFLLVFLKSIDILKEMETIITISLLEKSKEIKGLIHDYITLKKRIN